MISNPEAPSKSLFQISLTPGTSYIDTCRYQEERDLLSFSILTLFLRVCVNKSHSHADLLGYAVILASD